MYILLSASIPEILSTINTRFTLNHRPNTPTLIQNPKVSSLLLNIPHTPPKPQIPLIIQRKQSLLNPNAATKPLPKPNRIQRQRNKRQPPRQRSVQDRLDNANLQRQHHPRAARYIIHSFAFAFPGTRVRFVGYWKVRPVLTVAAR
ncbi:uncharacterized protein N7515_006159 [Penicillium bovifimosum]|uniref:Uncharacterized protein n=1 Tax=Penicillium bovifimosum TaxID=126998 RepID=A0A9W9GU42_9EURO|nr:uncharacterized protein N7515_006159 [Penicillium bovifimosum]KAJ5130120.1 hypothetical protein N7515_006159 [Penicillium bovifimosum]